MNKKLIVGIVLLVCGLGAVLATIPVFHDYYISGQSYGIDALLNSIAFSMLVIILCVGVAGIAYGLCFIYIDHKKVAVVLIAIVLATTLFAGYATQYVRTEETSECRAVAYLDTPAGRRGIYGYARSQVEVTYDGAETYLINNSGDVPYIENIFGTTHYYDLVSNILSISAKEVPTEINVACDGQGYILVSNGTTVVKIDANGTVVDIYKPTRIGSYYREMLYGEQEPPSSYRITVAYFEYNVTREYIVPRHKTWSWL